MCLSALNHTIYKLKSKFPGMASKVAHHVKLFFKANLTSHHSSLYTLNTKHTKFFTLPMDVISAVHQFHHQKNETGVGSVRHEPWLMGVDLSLLPLLILNHIHTQPHSYRGHSFWELLSAWAVPRYQSWPIPEGGSTAQKGNFSLKSPHQPAWNFLGAVLQLETLPTQSSDLSNTQPGYMSSAKTSLIYTYKYVLSPSDGTVSDILYPDVFLSQH